MDTPLSISLVEKANSFPSTAGDLPAPTPRVRDRTAAPAPSSDGQDIPDMTGPQSTTSTRNAKLPESAHEDTETSKSKTIHVKAQRSRPRLLTLIACVSYLLFHLMGIDIGLRTIQGYTEPRLQDAKVQLDNTYQALTVDYLLDIQLSNLHDTTLDRRYTETSYEDCLARGLHKANHIFRDLDFTSSPHIRNRTADWVTSNCRRLFYAPQVHSLRASKLRVQAGEIRQTIQELLRLVRYRIALLQCRLHGGNPRPAAKPVLIESAIDTNKRPRVLPDMPYGFSLDCEDQTRCRLVHSGPSIPDKTSKTLQDATTDARKEVEKWSYKFERMYVRIDYLRRPLAILQPLLIVCYLLATMITLRQPRPQPKLSFAKKNAHVWKHVCYVVAQLQGQERHAVGLLINTALYALLGFQLDYIIPEFDRLLLPVGLSFCVFHSVHAAIFFDSPPVDHSDESLYDVVRTVKELYLIAQGIKVQELPPTQRPTAEPKTHPAPKPASKIAARFISPLTPIAEDLQQERKAMHAEQGKASRDDVRTQDGYATETDEEYDSDVEHSSYVDLAGGATPTDSEEGDLVIVEE